MSTIAAKQRLPSSSSAEDIQEVFEHAVNEHVLSDDKDSAAWTYRYTYIGEYAGWDLFVNKITHEYVYSPLNMTKRPSF